jgi:hypothetical protein
MTVVTSRRTVRVDALRNTPQIGGLTSTRELFTVASEVAFGSGTDDGDVDEVWKHEGSLAAAASETHDLQSLTQLDDDGKTVRSSISFDGVKELILKNTTLASVGGFLTVGEAASNIWDGAGTPFSGGTGSTTGTFDLAPGDVLYWSSRAGGAVSGSAKDLLVSATTATQTYELQIVGEAT